MPGLQYVVNKTWRPRERNRGLSNIVARIGEDAFAKLLLLLAGAVGPDQHAIATGFSHRFHHQLVEILQNMVALLGISEQIRFQIVQHRIFAQIVLDDLGHIGIQRFIISHAGAEGVGQSHIPGAICIE